MTKKAFLTIVAVSVIALSQISPCFAGKLPEDASQSIQTAQKSIDQIFNKLIGELEGLQTKLTQAGDLENAIAVRDKIKTLKVSYQSLFLEVLPDPGDLTKFKSVQVGDVMFFKVLGQTQGGTVWGTDLYTTDSRLAIAAVHAGAVKANEEGIVKVTFAPGQASYQGTTRNGVTTSNWGGYQISFKVEAVQ